MNTELRQAEINFGVKIAFSIAVFFVFRKLTFSFPAIFTFFRWKLSSIEILNAYLRFVEPKSLIFVFVFFSLCRLLLTVSVTSEARARGDRRFTATSGRRAVKQISRTKTFCNRAEAVVVMLVVVVCVCGVCTVPTVNERVV